MRDGFGTDSSGLFSAVVLSNKRLGGDFFRLSIGFGAGSSKVFSQALPGQFIQLDLSGVSLPAVESIPEHLLDVSGRSVILRRPFSIAGLAVEGALTAVEVLYRVVGPATLRMTALSAGDNLSVIGPLGNGFSISAGMKNALLIGGGAGVAPLLCLAGVLSRDYPGVSVRAFVGTKTVEELPFAGSAGGFSGQLGDSLAEFACFGVKSLVATDDGSAGCKGFVTEAFVNWLGESDIAVEDTVIYACGPEPMLASVAGIAGGRGIDCQVSMERMMGCGIGLCQSCAVECKEDNTEATVYKLCCKDGPVFNAEEVVFRT